MQPYYGTVQLGTPAVTNGGLNYLESFLNLCTGCTFNFVNVHFFVDRSEMNVAQFISALQNYVGVTVPAVQAKHAAVKGLPIVIGQVSLFLFFPFLSFPSFLSPNLPIHSRHQVSE